MTRRRLAWGAVLVGLIVVGIPVLLPVDSPKQEGPLQGSPPAGEPPSSAATAATTAATTPTRTVAGSRSAEGTGWVWRRLDPVSLEDVDSSSLLLGDPSASVVTPDGSTLLSFSHAYRPEDTEELLVVGLDEWQVDARFPVTGWVAPDQSGGVDGPLLGRFSPGAKDFFWVSQLPAGRQAVPEPGDFALLRLRSGGRPQMLVAFPEDFEPWEMRFLDTRRLAVFGTPVVYSDEPVPDADRWARLLVVDVESSLVDELPLPGLVAGRVWQGDDPGTFAHPALGWDLERGLLYVVHADQEVVTVVDLGDIAVVAEEDFALAGSVGERLVQWLLPSAQAKVSEGTRRNVRLHPDGGHLFVSGVRWELVTNQAGQVTGERQVALGLTLIRTSDLAVVSRIDLPVSDVELSPWGDLLLSGVSDGRTVDNDPEQSGLYVLDTSSLEARAHVLPDTIPWLHGFRPDGSLYVSYWDASAGLGMLSLLDLESFELASERRLDDNETTGFGLPLAGLIAQWTES